MVTVTVLPLADQLLEGTSVYWWVEGFHSLTPEAEYVNSIAPHVTSTLDVYKRQAYTGNISLEATWSKAKYSATLSGTNVSASSGFGTQAATYTTAWTGTFTATAGYVLPDSISVTVDGKTLDSSNYTYTKSTGTVSITVSYTHLHLSEITFSRARAAAVWSPIHGCLPSS